jgi:hypothetical protein
LLQLQPVLFLQILFLFLFGFVLLFLCHDVFLLEYRF